MSYVAKVWARVKHFIGICGCSTIDGYLWCEFCKTQIDREVRESLIAERRLLDQFSERMGRR